MNVATKKHDIVDALEELRSRHPIELHKFYEMLRRRTGCGAVFNPSNDYN